MRRTEFDRLVRGEFGSSFAAWIEGTHVISSLGDTAGHLIEQGYDLRQVWEGLCEDFDVPESRQLGEDVEGF
ncbi:DUF3046 domain-containing protein [Corynebacterium sp. 320]|uniref:DUF3046 domain-containing protein n=2 Tax=Corynebacterium TaxID=1716 RepID=A0ABQ6VGW8_9CORY|nr:MULTISPECIES: DUF3046 domain-containing protein [Corynebacterium]KAB1504526.1 DUF3046 domain-containing protein [Corynebacterium sp. 320]KAB1553414.1 DUF3046 domain-containing protein [Corynebacterium sp. 321]KAB1554477.1 DUF3046 domain-containing protein [Corynebacterium sp. 319]KAB3523662.1 DUF3046 domain-containing protein [Corynebacterium zhongnanshanii]KAB3528662.1 DUF3046 domain-containing protein [Corynebacterium sp. 250]